MNILAALEIVKSESMTRMKKAVKTGNTVYVSPAMYELISKEKGEDLQRLLANLPLMDIGQFNVYKAMEDMLTTRGQT